MQLNSPITTSHSAADGRLKVDVGRRRKKKKALKKMVKKCNGRGGPGIKTTINNQNLPKTFKGFNIKTSGLQKSGTMLVDIMQRMKAMEKTEREKFLGSFRNMNIKGPQLKTAKKVKAVDMSKR